MAIAENDLGHFKTLGETRKPKIMRTVLVMLIVSFVCVLSFLIFVPWVQTTSGPGQVTALNPDDRQQEINALVSGRIEEWFVRDGSVVKEGDPIVRIGDIDPMLIQRLQAERVQLEIQLSAAQNGMATAQLDLDRMRDLFSEGLAARRDFEQAQIRVEDFRSRVAEANANLNRIDTTLSRQSEQTVLAPRDGFIQSLNAGDSATIVNAGDVLATFVPEASARVVEIFVDGRDVSLIQDGDDARLQFEGWPAVQFSGWPSVAIGTFEGYVVAVDPSAQPDGRFRVLIAEHPSAQHPWPEERYVRFGANARGWVLLETVPVGFEVWRQLNNFPPQLPASTDPAAATGGA
ncbi:MAG: HlyD family efflux transporter periplasmic adaptor subunit [Pseudomonadota bacterium]